MTGSVPFFVLAVIVVLASTCYGQAPPGPTSDSPDVVFCDPADPNTCPDSFECDDVSSICQPTDPQPTVCSADSDCPDGLICGLTFLCVTPDAPPLSGPTAYILMGVGLAVVVIIVIIILVLSCGRWRRATRVRSQKTQRSAFIKPVTMAAVAPRLDHRKPRLKFGVQKNSAPAATNVAPPAPAPAPPTNELTGNKTVFVMGDSGPAQAMQPNITPSATVGAAGPHVAVVGLDSSVRTSSIPAATPGTSSQQLESRPHEKASQAAMMTVPGLYPSIATGVGIPQHQINIQAAVPMAGAVLPQPQQLVAQPLSLYPNIGHTHAHAQVIAVPQTSAQLGPPAYQTTDRRDTQAKF